MDDPTGSTSELLRRATASTVPAAPAVEAQLIRLVRQRLGGGPEQVPGQLDEGARAWAVGRKPRAARRQPAAR